MNIESVTGHAKAALEEYRRTSINVRIAEGLMLGAGVVLMFNDPESTDYCSGQQQATIMDYACSVGTDIHEMPGIADTRDLVQDVPYMKYRAELKAYLAASDRTELTATQTLGNPYGIEAPQTRTTQTMDRYLAERQSEELSYDALGYSTYVGSGVIAAALPGILMFVAGRYAWRRHRNKLRVQGTSLLIDGIGK